MDKKATSLAVRRVFLERTQNRAQFRIRAEGENGETINLSFPANTLGNFRTMVENFHEWQKRGWGAEGPEVADQEKKKEDSDDLLQPEVREALRRQMENG